MATEKAKKLAREIAGTTFDKYATVGDAPDRAILADRIATALDQHGAALARLAAEDAWRRAREWFGNEEGSRGSLYSINAAVQHAMEAQDD